MASAPAARGSSTGSHSWSISRGTSAPKTSGMGGGSRGRSVGQAFQPASVGQAFQPASSTNGRLESLPYDRRQAGKPAPRSALGGGGGGQARLGRQLAGDAQPAGLCPHRVEELRAGPGRLVEDAQQLLLVEHHLLA